jgi:hypothetical protein
MRLGCTKSDVESNRLSRRDSGRRGGRREAIEGEGIEGGANETPLRTDKGRP